MRQERHLLFLLVHYIIKKTVTIINLDFAPKLDDNNTTDIVRIRRNYDVCAKLLSHLQYLPS